MSSDLFFMRRAIELGSLSLPLAGTNPAVGAVLALGDQLVGEGYHHGPGSAHAEIEALKDAETRGWNSAKLPRGTILYCSLEPCCHRGGGKRTPPCTEAIIASGIQRVVIACLDPNPLVAGKGLLRLKEAGIQVEAGLLSEEAAFLLDHFSISITLGRPFITLKWAQSLDGRIASQAGIYKWITSESARRAAHKLRARHDAVMVGAGTLRQDNPQLTVRLPDFAQRPQPKRIVVAGKTQLDWNAHLLNPPLAEGTIVLAAEGTDTARQGQKAKDRGLGLVTLPADADGRPDLQAAMAALYSQGMASVMVEGGSALLGALVKARLWDALTVFIAPSLLGEGLGPLGHLGIVSPEDGIQLSEASISSGDDYFRLDARREKRITSLGLKLTAVSEAV